MLRYTVLSLLFFLFNMTAIAQIGKKPLLKPEGVTINGRQLNDTIAGNKFNEETMIELSAKTHYTDYKIISYSKDTTVVDTTLSLKKEHLFNHLRKDKFELQSFHNLGSPYNHLGYDFSSVSLFPKTGMRAVHLDFLEREAIQYYRVPTPTSELFFRTGIQQGQVLNSLLTTNIHPQLNLSLAYKGLRSLGDYRNALASHQNFRTTLSFASKNKKYEARTHFVAHNLLNQENGGLTNASYDLFVTDNSEFYDRERLEVNYTNAESRLKGKRYYFEHSYHLWQHRDTTKHRTSDLQIGHEFTYSDKHYYFNQDEASDFIGEAYQNKIADSTYHKTMDNALFAKFKSPYILGSLGFKATLSQHNYGYYNILYLDEQTIPEKLKGNIITAEANWNAAFKTFSLNTKVGTIISGDFTGNYLTGTASYTKDSLFTAKATIAVQSQAPNFNFLLYQSNYVNYNWHTNFNNENTQFLGFSFESEKLLDLEVGMALKENYIYFDASSRPQQYSDVLSYVKAKVHKAISYRKFTLDNTLLYQKVVSGSEVFHVPEIVTENSLYFADYIFKGNPLYLQTGLTFKYFTNYKADEFNPLLNEFRLQNTMEIGNYPMLDVFLNAQIRRTRFFVKAENISSFFTGRTYFATPTQPYRDFKVRFGLVWNFFI